MDEEVNQMTIQHEHVVRTFLFHVEIPYRMTPQELEFEAPVGVEPTLADLTTGDYTEDELRRILRGTVLLLEKYPHRDLNEALHTAMVWERG